MSARLAGALAVVLAGCSNAPDVVGLGTFESPCATSADCDTRLCLQIDGLGSCTVACTDGACPLHYACVSDVCVPSRREDARCRPEHARCGPSFARCCAGSDCVEWPGWGPRCSRFCDSSRPCWSGCCAESEIGMVCAPPSHCE